MFEKIFEKQNSNEYRRYCLLQVILMDVIEERNERSSHTYNRNSMFDIALHYLISTIFFVELTKLS